MDAFHFRNPAAAIVTTLRHASVSEFRLSNRWPIVCLSASKKTGQSTRIVRQTDAQFEYHPDVNTLVYQSEGKELTVHLMCRDTDSESVKSRQESPENYVIDVESRCCCPGKCHYSSGSMGAGAVLVILFVCILVVYVIGGMIYLRVRVGASGIDLIPNRAAWLTFGSLSVLGVRYTLAVIRQQTFQVNYEKL